MTFPIVECGCTTPDHHGEPGTVYYVTIMSERRTQFVRAAGPFPTHRAALAALPGVRRDTLAKYAKAAWYVYGTAGERATA